MVLINSYTREIGKTQTDFSVSDALGADSFQEFLENKNVSVDWIERMLTGIQSHMSKLHDVIDNSKDNEVSFGGSVDVSSVMEELDGFSSCCKQLMSVKSTIKERGQMVQMSVEKREVGSNAQKAEVTKFASKKGFTGLRKNKKDDKADASDFNGSR